MGSAVGRINRDVLVWGRPPSIRWDAGGIQQEKYVVSRPVVA
jgi:hypothetical protein